MIRLLPDYLVTVMRCPDGVLEAVYGFEVDM
jgi:hypothetical protein